MSSGTNTILGKIMSSETMMATIMRNLGLAMSEALDAEMLPEGFKQETLDLQKDLTARGFYTGPLDGIDGPRTQAAVDLCEQSVDLYNEKRIKAVDIASELVSVIASSKFSNSGVEQSGSSLVS
jgi:hypothetical protein